MNSLLPRGGVLGAVVVVIVCLLIALPWENVDSSFDWNKDPVPGTEFMDTEEYTRESAHITSHGETLEAWFYMPKAKRRHLPKPPIIIMGHGMGVQKDFGLHNYAHGFASAGIAVLVFDYRTFGGSTGLPRNWVSPRRHVEDWKVVVKHVLDTSIDGRVDSTRVALWGVSYSGGHSLVTAAHYGHAISAVVANEPYLSPQAIFHEKSADDLVRMLRLLAAGLSDELRRLLGLPPVYVRLAAPMREMNSTLALLPLKDSEVTPGPRPVVVRQGGWQNKALARVVLEALGYNPSAYLHKVQCPVFIRVGLRDHICPPEVVREAAKKLHAGFVLQERDTTHLGAHRGGSDPQEMAPVIDFLKHQFYPSEGEDEGGVDAWGGFNITAAARSVGVDAAPAS